MWRPRVTLFAGLGPRTCAPPCSRQLSAISRDRSTSRDTNCGPAPVPVTPATPAPRPVIAETGVSHTARRFPDHDGCPFFPDALGAGWRPGIPAGSAIRANGHCRTWWCGAHPSGRGTSRKPAVAIPAYEPEPESELVIRYLGNAPRPGRRPDRVWRPCTELPTKDRVPVLSFPVRSGSLAAAAVKTAGGRRIRYGGVIRVLD